MKKRFNEEQIIGLPQGTRSDVVRFALEKYLDITMAETDQDGRTTDKLKKGAAGRSHQ